MIRIGILSLQGSVAEHKKMLENFEDIEAIDVKTKADINSIDGVVLPGGESTTIGKLLRDFYLSDPLKDRIEKGMPAWGTCAGMILLAKEIVGDEAHLSVMDIKVRRNAYGKQIDSFMRESVLPEISPKPITLKFIRAPWIEKAGESVDILGVLDGHIIAARQKNMLATSFHPELTNDLSVYRYFISMITNIPFEKQ